MKEAFPNRLAGAYYGYVILPYTPEGSTANFERVLASPYIDYMRATTVGYNLTDGLHRHLHSVFRHYGKLSSIEADIRTHVGILHKNSEPEFTCKTPEETTATVRKVMGNSFLYGTGAHFVDFGRDFRWFNCPEALTTIHRGIEIWQKLFAEPPVCDSDIAVILDPMEVTRQGYPDFYKNYPLMNAMTTNPLQSLSFSGLSYDFLSPEDYLAGTHDYKAVVFLNNYSVNGDMRKALLAKLRRPGHLAVWNYAPGIISEKGFSNESMSELTGISLKAKYDKLPFAFKLTDGGGKIGPRENNKDLLISPRVYCDDSATEILGRYEDDQSPALVRKQLADGSTAVFAGVPVCTPELWAGLLSPVCHAYSFPGVFVRANSKLLQIHTQGGISPVRLPRRATEITDLFTGKTIAIKTDRFILKADTPFTWLLEIKTDGPPLKGEEK